MYQFAYNDVIEDAPQTMRAQERHAMERVIAMLRSVKANDVGGPECVQAIYYLRRLWSIFMDDLKSPENELPEQLRNNLLSVGSWVNKEADRVRAGQTTDLMPLIEINEIVCEGLK